MGEKIYSERCRTCSLYHIISNECMGKEYEEIPIEENIDGDTCSYYRKKMVGGLGMEHLEYIKEEEPAFYEDLVIENRLETHLIEIEKRASEMLINLEDAEMKKHPNPYNISETLKFAAYKNNVRDRMLEIVRRDLIYTKGL